MNRKLEICPCCMEKHEEQIIKMMDSTIFKGVSVEYEAQYHYCKLADEYFEDEQLKHRTYTNVDDFKKSN